MNRRSPQVTVRRGRTFTAIACASPCRLALRIARPARTGANGNQARPRRRAGIAVPEERRRIRQARERQARQQGEGHRLRLEPARRRQGDGPEAQARHARHGAAVDGDELRGRHARASSRCPTSSRTARTWRASRRKSSGRRSSRKSRRRESRCWRSGRTACATSRTASGRSRFPPTCRASSCACPKASGASRCSRRTARIPSPMKFSELFTALQTGVMDGQENPFTQIYSAKLQEVQKYLSLSGHVYTPAYLDRRHANVGSAACRRAQDARGHGEGDAGVRLRRPPRTTTTNCSASSSRRACRSTTSTRTRSSRRASRSTTNSARKCRGPRR